MLATRASGDYRGETALFVSVQTRNPVTERAGIREDNAASMAIPGVAIRGPRSLLRQIREALAGGGPAQARLDMVVRIIALSMVADVCSIYLRRASGEMELFATEGLDTKAVHVTRMKPGEGLVGEIIRQGSPLNLADAPEHQAFSFRPETGESPLHGFLGV